MERVIATSKRVKWTSAKVPTSNVAHCRVCGFGPRPPKAGVPDFAFEKILEHIKDRHFEQGLGADVEFQIMLEQEEGHDEHCSFHGCRGTR